jgi:hypothetical protein
MGAAIRQLQRTVPRRQWGKESKQWRAVIRVVQRLQQFFAVVPRRRQLGRRTKVEQKQQQKQEQEQEKKQKQKQEQKQQQKQKNQQKQEQKATSKGRSLSNRWGKEPKSTSD